MNFNFTASDYLTAVTDAYGNCQGLPLAQAIVEVAPWQILILDAGAGVYRANVAIMPMTRQVQVVAGVALVIQGKRELFGNVLARCLESSARATSGVASMISSTAVVYEAGIDRDGMAAWPRVPANSLVEYAGDESAD